MGLIRSDFQKTPWRTFPGTAANSNIAPRRSVPSVAFGDRLAVLVLFGGILLVVLIVVALTAPFPGGVLWWCLFERNGADAVSRA